MAARVAGMTALAVIKAEMLVDTEAVGVRDGELMEEEQKAWEGKVMGCMAEVESTGQAEGLSVVGAGIEVPRTGHVVGRAGVETQVEAKAMA